MKFARLVTIWVSSTALLAAVACDRRAPEPEGRAARAAPAPSAAPEPAVVAEPKASAPARAEGHLTWTDPSGWSRLPQTSPMRVATYKVPREGGDSADAELAVFHFGGGQGGDVESNLKRWENQFTDTKKADVVRSERTVNGLRAHLLEVASGTYTAMMPGQDATPKSSYGMIAAVVETPLGSYFVKLTGPARTVKAKRDAYFTMLDSVRVEG